MTGFSRFIIVSSLPDNLTQKDFTTLCLEFGPIRSCRVHKSEKGTTSGFCEFENCDSATMAVQNLNARSQKEGSQIRASFSKSRLQNTRTCHIRVKYLPKNIPQEEVCAEFARFGNITRCKLVQYEQNSTAHLSFDSVDSADLARQSLNGQCWSDHSDRLMIEFNSAYPSNGRKSNSHPDDQFAEQQSSYAVSEEAIFSQQPPPQQNPQMNSFYNFMQPGYDVPPEYASQPSAKPAQYVQLNSYCWPSNYVAGAQQSGLMYDGQAPQNGLAQNGLAASSPPVKSQEPTASPHWAQFYSQLVQQMQQTHLYPTGAAQYSAAQSQYAMPAQQTAGSQPLLLNPQSVYCATALSPTPQNYQLFLNPQAAPAQGYFRGLQPAQMGQTAAGFGRFGAAGAGGQFRPVMGGYQTAGGGKGQLGGGGRQNANNTLYVYNTGNSMTEEGLRSLFSSFGTILDVSVPRDPGTGASRNFGFVNYLEGSAARVAIERMNGYMFYDRVLQVSYKRPRVSTANSSNNNNAGGSAQAQQQPRGGGGTAALKEKKEEQPGQQQEPAGEGGGAAGPDEETPAEAHADPVHAHDNE